MLPKQFLFDTDIETSAGQGKDIVQVGIKFTSIFYRQHIYEKLIFIIYLYMLPTRKQFLSFSSNLMLYSFYSLLKH